MSPTHPITLYGAHLDPTKLRAATGLYDWLDYVWPTIDERARAEACVGLVLGIAPPPLTVDTAEPESAERLQDLTRSLTAERFAPTPRRS